MKEDKTTADTLKEDVIKKRARLVCADVQIYNQGIEIVINKLYHNEFTNTYFERSTQCFPAICVVRSSIHVIDRETVERDWLAEDKYPKRIDFMRKYSGVYLDTITSHLEHAEYINVSSFLEEAVRIIKFMIKDVRF